jgi:hypothetical protein
MKYYLMLSVVLLLFSNACSDSVYEPQLPALTMADLSKYKMKILPDQPVSSAEIRLVVYEECKYNKLMGVKREGSTIVVEKQYNSMIMAPCVLTNDTISLGKLPVGTYRVDYKLVDIAYQPSGKSTFSMTFKLSVAK